MGRTREAYADVLLAFQDWCSRRELNFRAEMSTLIRGRMGSEPSARMGEQVGESMPCSLSIDRPTRTPQEKRDYAKAYYLANKDRIKAYQRDYARRRRKGVSHVR